MEIAIRPREPTDDEAIVAIHNRIDSDLPPRSLEAHLHQMATKPEGCYDGRWVAEGEGRVVGDAVLRQDYWRSEPGAYRCVIEVEPDLWGRGIGSLLYTQLMAAAEPLEIGSL